MKTCAKRLNSVPAGALWTPAPEATFQVVEDAGVRKVPAGTERPVTNAGSVLLAVGGFVLTNSPLDVLHRVLMTPITAQLVAGHCLVVIEVSGGGLHLELEVLNHVVGGST